MHFSLDSTITSTSWSVDAGLPSAPVSPQPVTVATWPVYKEATEAGRQIGAALEEKVMGEVRVSIEKS